MTFALPVFVMVTVCEAEEVPVVTFPKLRLVGLTPRVRVAPIPVPLRPTEVGEPGALLTIEMFPDGSANRSRSKGDSNCGLLPDAYIQGK